MESVAHPLISLLVSPATPTRALGQVPKASCATRTTPTTAAAALPSISLCALKATTNDLCLWAGTECVHDGCPCSFFNQSIRSPITNAQCAWAGTQCAVCTNDGCSCSSFSQSTCTSLDTNDQCAWVGSECVTCNSNNGCSCP